MNESEPTLKPAGQPPYVVDIRFAVLALMFAIAAFVALVIARGAVDALDRLEVAQAPSSHFVLDAEHTWTDGEMQALADARAACEALPDAGDDAGACRILLLPPNGPQPSVGLYWFLNSDPTVTGEPAPLYQLLVRTDTPSIYYKSGSANTAWTLIGTSSGGGGGVTGTGTANTITKWTGTTSVGNSSATDNGTTYAIGTGGVSVLEATGETLLPEIDLTGHVTAPVLSGTTNNWNPTGTGALSGIARIDEAPSANVIITGLNVGNASQVVSIHNTATAFTLTLANASAGSLAANQFTNPNAGDVTIPPGGAVTLRTSASASGWRVWSSGTANTALTPNDLAIATDTNTIGNYGGSTAIACPAGEADTQPALSAAGVISAATCVAFAPAGNISGTTNTIAKFTSASAIGNSSATDDGTTFAVNTNKLTVNESTGATVAAGQITGVGVAGVHAYSGTYFEWYEDFMISGGVLGASSILQQGSISYTLSAGACTANTGTTTRPGIVECTTGTSTTGRSSWISSTQAVDFNSGNWTFQWVGGVSAVSSGTDTYTVLAGFSDTNAAVNIANGCFFLYDEGNVAAGNFNAGNANDWECICAKGSTRTGYLMNGVVVSDGGFTTVAAPVAAYTAPSSNIDNLQVVMTGETEADFFVNGTKSCEITTNIPGTSSNLTGWEWQILKSAGSTSRFSVVDYMLTTVNLNAARSP